MTDYNKVTKYRNDMNLVPLKNFNAIEINLFFAICTRLKDQGTEVVPFEFHELKALSNYEQRLIERFVNDLEHVYDKMQQLTYTERTENKIKKFTLFTYYEIDIDNQQVEIALNPKLSHILNNITDNFTRFELQELTNIKTSYAKNMFRLLKQFRSTGLFKISIEDFRERLDVPSSYKMCDIDKRVLKYIERDLSESFNNLKIEKKYKGRKVVGLEFTFDIEDPKKKKDKKEIKVIEQLTQEKSKEMWDF